MFKALKGGLRRSSGGSGVSRVSATRLTHVRDLSTDNLRRPAFQPQYPQEAGQDSKSARLSGLED